MKTYPQYGTLDPNDAIDWGHPLNNGRVGLWALLQSKITNNYIDLARKNHAVRRGTRTRGTISSPRGVFVNSDYNNTGTHSDDYTATISSLGLSINSAHTISAWSWVSSSTHTLYYAAIDDGSSNYSVIYKGSGIGNRFYTGNGNSVNSSILPLSQWTHYVGVYTGSAASLYINGILRAGPTNLTWQSGSAVNYRISRLGPYSNPSGDAKILTCSLWNRALSASEVWAEYCTSKQDYCTPNSPLKWGRSRKWFFVAPTITTYTGTAALSTTAATIAASGTHTAPTYTASPSLTTEAATISASGTFTAPVYTAAVALATEVAALAADGTHAAPTATGTASLTTEAATLDATGTHTAPTYTATAILACEAATTAASGTHTTPTFAGTAGLATDAATITASGTFAAPVYTASVTLATETATLAADGQFTTPTYTGTASLNLDPATMSASGANAAAVSLNTESATVAASGTYTALTTPRIIIRGADRGRVFVGEDAGRVIKGADCGRVWQGEDTGRVLTGADCGRVF